MVLRKLRKLFRQESGAHMHPRKSGVELIVCQRLDEILCETFYGKVSIYTYAPRPVYRMKKLVKAW